MFDFEIRKFEQEDKAEVCEMMKEFYNSPFVSTNGSGKIYEIDFNTCISNSPLLEGFIFYNEKDILGYGIISKSFSTEFGKICVWFEDLYVKPKYRGNGIVPKFITYIRKQFPINLFKLEVEKSNENARHVYKKYGFRELPYVTMIL